MKSLTNFAVDLDSGSDTATLTISGPSTVWFGVGLGAQVMKDSPNAIIVAGNGTVFEQKLGDQQAGKRLALSVKVVSNTVANGLRTVVLTRALKGLTTDHFTFDVTAPSVKYINAIGRGSTFAYHKSRAASTVSLTAVDAHTAVAQFKLEAGCKCLRHQPLHLLFTADGRLFAFEVLDPRVVKNQHRNDLYVRWATPTPTDEKAARLEALADYLARYTAATRLQTCGRPGRRVKAAKPEYGFLLFGNAVARDAVLELGNVRVDGRTLHVRPRTYSGDAVAPRRHTDGYYAPKQQAYVDASRSRRSSSSSPTSATCSARSAAATTRKTDMT